MMRIIILAFLISMAKTAFTEPLAFPSAIERVQDSMVDQTICESRWRELAATIGIERHTLSDHTEVWLIPCANWAGNLAWSVYARIEEATHADGAITKNQLFVTYSPYEGTKADNVIYNMHWSESDQSLVSEYHLSWFSDCGSRARYQWNSSQQNFVVTQLQKKDDCSPEAKWEFVIDRKIERTILTH